MREMTTWLGERTWLGRTKNKELAVEKEDEDDTKEKEETYITQYH